MASIDPLKEHTDQCQRCTCGWRRFREATANVEQPALRWVFYGTVPSGFGSVPHGTLFGASEAGWGLFEAVLQQGGYSVYCENCTRRRRTVVTSSITLFGGYAFGNKFYVVAGDVTSTGCYFLEFRGPVTLSVPLKLSTDPIQPFITDQAPLQGPEAVPPPGAEVASTILEATIPSVPIEGDYTVVFVNRCFGTELELDTLRLEVDVIVLVPNKDADLNGAPEIWLQKNWLSGVPASQPQTGSVKGIPFDKCVGVIEYDARFGVVPSAAGFSHAGSGAAGDYTLAAGGVLRGATLGGGLNSYWTKTIALPVGVDQVHSYARYRIDAVPSTPPVDPDDGLTFMGRYSVAADAIYRGVRYTYHYDTIHTTKLDASGEAVWTEGVHDINGWNQSAMSNNPGAAIAQGWHNGHFDQDLSFGTDTGAPLADELDAVFGDLSGEGMTAHIRNFVVSAPGRFIRSWFRSYSTVTSPTLRMYLTADAGASGEVTARFKIRYGSADPYVVPANEADVTATFITRNQVFEIPVNLPGLTAQQPFWFTIERDYTHADDKITATVWLMEATVRGA